MGWEVPGRTVKVTVVLRVPETVMTSGLLKGQRERDNRHKPGHRAGQQEAGTQSTRERVSSDRCTGSEHVVCHARTGTGRRAGGREDSPVTRQPSHPTPDRGAAWGCLRQQRTKDSERGCWGTRRLTGSQGPGVGGRPAPRGVAGDISNMPEGRTPLAFASRTGRERPWGEPSLLTSYQASALRLKRT